MATRSFALIGVFVLSVCAGMAGAAADGPRAVPQGPEGYAWAGACKDCHAEIHASWEKSKHGHAWNRLRGAAASDPACINCHVTGRAGKIEKEGTLLNAGVQCESCHGPSAAHVANAMEKPPTRLPGPEVCQGCHNERSPHYRGFVYQGMLKFGSHAVPGR
jgi:predicted CXXCH cytochrome family protein